MASDLLEKGAILQRDKETYAIAPHIPGGIITDFNLLRRLADTAEKYGAKAIKLTSAERFAVVGLRPETLTLLYDDQKAAERETEGVIDEVIYFGDMTYYDVILDGTDHEVRISMRNVPGRPVLDRGARTRVAWSPTALVLFR